jgi:hypothetical protein
MAEPGQTDTNECTSIPYGKRIIGIEDPQKLTREEFNKSKELLFHGSIEPFAYSPRFAYDENFCSTYDGSMTLGSGIYTTPDRNQAENYSLVRQQTEGSLPYIAVFLPNKAVMLDLREKNSLAKNAPIPKELFEKWRERYVRFYKDQDRSKLPWYENRFETEYLAHLDKLAQFPNIDLRVMLWTGSDSRIKDGFYPGPPWVDLFSQFMKDEGYDGVIYREGGEGEKGKDSPTFCFFNLEKINTFEGWQKRKELMTEPANSVRVKIFNLLTPSGFTPVPLEKLDPDNLGDIKEFHVEKIEGKTWDQLIKEGLTPFSMHLQIAKTAVEQMIYLKEKLGLLLGDRNASNIIVTDPEKIDTSTLKHIDFPQTYDISAGNYVGVEGKSLATVAEALTAREIAISLQKAALSTNNNNLALTENTIERWLNLDALPERRNLVELKEAIDKIVPPSGS